MKIFITGNMGYIGPRLIKYLRNLYPDAYLLGYDTGYFAHCLTDSPYLPECMADEQIFGDMRRIGADKLRGVDAVIHLAAISNDPMGKAFEDVTRAINYESSVHLAKMAKDAGVKRFVFASSCSMYGFAEGGPRVETDELNPLTAYARSKVGTEQDLSKLADDSFVVTSLRFATACGMSERLRLDLVLNDFVAGAITAREITILSDGTPWRPLIHVDDMVRAMDWGINRSADNGGVFLPVNTGSDSWNYQVRDLAEAVAKAIPGVKVSVNPDAPPDKRSYKVDFTLFRKVAPSHQPQVDLVGAIHGLKQGLTSMNFKEANFRQSQFMRLKVLTGFREKGILNDALEWVAK